MAVEAAKGTDVEVGEKTALLRRAAVGPWWTFGLVDFVDELREAVGGKLLVLLFAVEHVMRGFVDDFTKQSASYVYKSYSTSAPQIQIYGGITQLPWALKPVIGLVSDVFPIGGYNKFPYMMVFTVAGSLAFLVVGAAPESVLPVTGVVVCLFLQSMQLSTLDILTEAKYAEKIQEKPRYGPGILSYVWFGMHAGSLAAMALSGLFIAISPKLPYLISALPAALVMIPLMLNYLEEKPKSSEEVEKVKSKLLQERESVFLCLLIAVVCMGMTACGLCVQSTKINALVSVVCALIVTAAFCVLLAPEIAMFSAWSMIQASLSWSTSGASFYFMTDTAEEYPEGPHFSSFFYNSVIGSFGAIMAILGIVMFQKYLSRYPYRMLLVITNIAFSLANMLDVMLYTRANKRWGIPDHAFVLGTGTAQNILDQWQWMPQVIILSYFCPKGMEATVYALLAGSHNLGNTVAMNCGALLLESLGVNPDGSVGESAQFENLWKASAISGILPVITIVLLFRLVPDVQQGDPVMEDRGSPSEGCLWRRLFA